MENSDDFDRLRAAVPAGIVHFAGGRENERDGRRRGDASPASGAAVPLRTPRRGLRPLAR